MSNMELPRRNGQVVEVALREMTKQIFDQQIRIDGLNAALTTLLTRLNALEQEISLKKAMAMGHGPTT